jgi:hypothetical protein
LRFCCSYLFLQMGSLLVSWVKVCLCFISAFFLMLLLLQFFSSFKESFKWWCWISKLSNSRCFFFHPFGLF